VLIGKVAEVQAVRKDATEFDAELSLSTWTSREGMFFSGIIRDISDRKEAERALEQRTQEARARTAELESLIQMVAHDLKSPVIAMVGFVRALRARLGKGTPDPKMEQILQQLTNAGTSMESFLGDLLDGLVCDQSASERAPVALDETIRQIVNQQSGLLRERLVTVRMDFAPDTPRVYADERRVRQVIDNILGNAVRHMGEKPGPIIRISVEEQGRFVVTRISDNGIGIPAEYLPRIFDRFFRVPKAEPSRGTGLGLAIAKKIIESHGGTIWVESEEGQGATFAFTMPKCSPPECTDEGSVEASA
jgi:signal transduction histidine kinase